MTGRQAGVSTSVGSEPGESNVRGKFESKLTSVLNELEGRASLGQLNELMLWTSQQRQPRRPRQI